MVDAKPHQDRVDYREKNRQEGTLRQAPGRNHSTSNSIVRPLTKKKKLAVQPTQKASAPPPTSPFVSTSSASSSMTNIELDSAVDSSSTGIEPKRD